MLHRCDVTQHLRQFGHAELTGSTGSMAELGQPELRPLVPWLVRHRLLRVWGHDFEATTMEGCPPRSNGNPKEAEGKRLRSGRWEPGNRRRRSVAAIM